MNYQETIQYLFTSTPVFEHVGASAYKEGLYNTKALDAPFGPPRRQYKPIHIAGTSGKGSCSHSLAAVLQAEGYRVGLYTSPHLVDFRERIRINGECVSEQYVIDFVEQERSFFEPLHPSFFELTTALAFKYFAERQVDIAIVEVGLGGRLDCTNIITPLLSIITNISKDHTQFLGNTLAQIATEKAGIIKPGIPVVIGEAMNETRPVFEKKAEEMHAPILFAEDVPLVLSSESLSEGGRKYHTEEGDFTGELGGDYQVKNMNTLLTALKLLRQQGIKCDREGFLQGINHIHDLTGLSGRWQRLRRQPLVICDTGHNVGGWQYLAPQIKAQACRQLRIVFGMVDDKDLDTVMDLLPKNGIYYWTQATTHRAIPVSEIKRHGDARQLHGTCFDSVESAYQAALKEASLEDFIFIGGSSYVVADLLSNVIF